MAEQYFTPEELAAEEWRDVPTFENRYRVSNLGRIRSHIFTSQGRILKTSPAGMGYQQLRLCQNGLARHYYVHELVAAAFIGKRPEGQEINHKDTNRNNNRALNLEYLSPEDNRAHARLNGRVPRGDNHWSRRKPQLTPRGERHPRAKITEQDVRYIRNSPKIAKLIGDELGLSFSMVCRIRRGKGWAHVK